MDTITNPIEKLPADQAFVSSVLELPTNPQTIDTTIGETSLTAIILSAFSLFIILILFKRIVNIIPSLFACVLRWKESINLEASVKLSNDRNYIAAAMIIPFIMVVESFGLYYPKYMEGLNKTWKIVAISATFLAYCTIRFLAGLVCKPTRSSKYSYQAGFKTSWSFFILVTILLLAIGGIASYANLDYSAVKITMYWISAVMYFILLLREFQIFASSCSFITAFLYLCGLEIVPSSLLVGSVFVF